jgi:hypothetical protein
VNRLGNEVVKEKIFHRQTIGIHQIWASLALPILPLDYDDDAFKYEIFFSRISPE